jgi:hypothetical protein
MNESHEYGGSGRQGQGNGGSGWVKNALGIGCLGCLTLVILVACLFGWIYYQGKTELTPIAEAYIRLAESGDYAAAYEEAGEDWREQQSFEEFESFYATYVEPLGERRSLTFTGTRQNTSTASGRTAVLAFTGVYDWSRDVKLTVTMKKYDGQWKVIGCHYQTSFFGELLTCDACGETQSEMTRFCPDCGAPMAAAQSGEESP